MNNGKKGKIKIDMINVLSKSKLDIENKDKILEERTITDNANITERNDSVSGSHYKFNSSKRSRSKQGRASLLMEKVNSRTKDKQDGERPDSALIL